VDHFHVFLQFISGSVGVLVFALSYFYAYFKPSAYMNAFVRLQFFIVSIISLNFLYSYTLTVFKGSLGLKEMYCLLSSVRAFGFLFLFGKLANCLYQATSSRFYIFLCSLVSGLLFVPLLQFPEFKLEVQR